MGGRKIDADALSLGSAERSLGERTLSNRAYEKVLSMIAQGAIAVGDKLPSEHSLSEEFQVSRPVLRKALKQLREDGVIASRQGSGSFVLRRPDTAAFEFAPVGSIADIQRTFEFRAAIEGEAAYFAAERRTEADLARLKASLDELDRCIRDAELGVDADEGFHVAICAASGNPYFLAARSSMKSNILMGMNLMRNLSLKKPQHRMDLVQQEHYAIFKAILAQVPTRARDAMRAHIDNARKRVFDGSSE